MPEFNTPVDIANRALQRVGAGFISTFADGSDRSNLVSFCYGKLRRAELQRNTWVLSTRRAPIRPLDINTMLVVPTLWNATVTYFYGCLVQDSNNTYWQSIQRDNLNNQPGVNFSAWVPYFGPLSVELYDSSTAYYIGELVYTAAGDGTFNVYQSQVSGNGLDPSLPNVWSNLTTYFKDYVVVVYAAWNSGTTYAAGATVLYTDGNYYTSLAAGNLNNIPPSSGTKWALMPILQIIPQQNTLTQAGTVVYIPSTPTPGLSQPLGAQPQTSPVTEWQESTVYSTGNFVMFNTVQYVSLVNSNQGNYPNSSADWAAITGGTSYLSLIDLNINNNPANTAAAWSSVTSYSTGNVVAASDGFNYTSLTNSNLNNNPANNASPTNWSQGSLTAWTTSFVGGVMNQQWRLIGGAAFSSGGVDLTVAIVTYPIGAGPVSDTWTKNVYRLPAGHLRKAPQDPKAGINSWLGAPGNLNATDWTFEGNFLCTWDGKVINYRFIADIQNVQEFPDMLSEMLSCSIALEICEPLTQSTAKKQVAAQEYKMRRTEAIQVDAIEVGPVMPPLDDLIATRL